MSSYDFTEQLRYFNFSPQGVSYTSLPEKVDLDGTEKTNVGYSLAIGATVSALTGLGFLAYSKSRDDE